MLRSMTHESCILGNHQNFRRTIQKRWLKFEARRGPKKVTLRLSLGEIIRMTWHDSGEGNSTAGDKQAWWLEREWNDRKKTPRVQRPHGPTRTTRKFLRRNTEIHGNMHKRKHTQKSRKFNGNLIAVYNVLWFKLRRRWIRLRWQWKTTMTILCTKHCHVVHHVEFGIWQFDNLHVNEVQSNCFIVKDCIESLSLIFV